MSATMLAKSFCKNCQILSQRLAVLSSVPMRNAWNKHWDPKWKKQRREKFLKIDLPNFQKIYKETQDSPEEMRSKMKREGRLPPRSFQERPLNISCTGDIMEQYVPPEGDGKQSLVTPAGAKQKVEQLGKKTKSYREMRKIRQFDEDFDQTIFAQEAHDIYVEAQSLLQNYKDNEDRLHDLVTETAYPNMTHGLEFKTLRWKFVEPVESARVAHIRTMEMMSKENLYAQVTVRFHTKQTMALYDRFGRLMLGSEKLIKNVLEYVVFEKHLANQYGLWRIHAKIIPDWIRPSEPVVRTFHMPEIDTQPDDTENENNSNKPEMEEHPPLATA